MSTPSNRGAPGHHRRGRARSPHCALRSPGSCPAGHVEPLARCTAAAPRARAQPLPPPGNAPLMLGELHSVKQGGSNQPSCEPRQGGQPAVLQGQDRTLYAEAFRIEVSPQGRDQQWAQQLHRTSHTKLSAPSSGSRICQNTDEDPASWCWHRPSPYQLQDTEHVLGAAPLPGKGDLNRTVCFWLVQPWPGQSFA